MCGLVRRFLAAEVEESFFCARPPRHPRALVLLAGMGAIISELLGGEVEADQDIEGCGFRNIGQDVGEGFGGGGGG